MRARGVQAAAPGGVSWRTVCSGAMRLKRQEDKDSKAPLRSLTSGGAQKKPAFEEVLQGRFSCPQIGVQELRDDSPETGISPIAPGDGGLRRNLGEGRGVLRQLVPSYHP